MIPLCLTLNVIVQAKIEVRATRSTLVVINSRISIYSLTPQALPIPSYRLILSNDLLSNTTILTINTEGQ